MALIVLCTIGEVVIIVSLVTDGLPHIRKKDNFGNAGYSRHQLKRITASVIRKDRRRARYGINA